MSLMSKSLSLLLLATLSINASTSQSEVVDYIKNNLVKNSRVKVDKVEVIEKQAIKDGWEVYFVNIHATVQEDANIFDKKVVTETLFVKDGMATNMLLDMKTGDNYKESIRPKLKGDIYSDKHLLAGDKNAEHKVAVFSDPQCPFCQEIVPELYETVKKNPKKIALYYYHLPLKSIHPVSLTITKVMLLEQAKGNMDGVIKLYNLQISPEETDETKILAEIKKQFGMSYTVAQINEKKILDAQKEDEEIATKSMISGTPTIYIDGKWDKTREEYKKLLGDREKS
ncbi:MAG: thioredoxin domain-containing protein [Epsilonproteobacteria bacterium]|nr:thioredoxin domain-containing protein [Campylobacterota bacterium]